MAAGDRNKKGEPVDFVRHYGATPGKLPTLCGNKRAGYITNEPYDVTCKNCIRKLKNIKR